jgi:hypothetical protein
MPFLRPDRGARGERRARLLEQGRAVQGGRISRHRTHSAAVGVDGGSWGGGGCLWTEKAPSILLSGMRVSEAHTYSACHMVGLACLVVSLECRAKSRTAGSPGRGWRVLRDTKGEAANLTSESPPFLGVRLLHLPPEPAAPQKGVEVYGSSGGVVIVRRWVGTSLSRSLSDRVACLPTHPLPPRAPLSAPLPSSPHLLFGRRVS